ncbi:hypothetical protein DKK68_00675 [Bifidobacterium asteroides]|nr:hypothetical protein DKK68_00095 [Bifidobacterium asteroides]PXY88724.1 hypothetical protein DKK68_00675 [Bifidobacterium asteroides]
MRLWHGCAVGFPGRHPCGWCSRRPSGSSWGVAPWRVPAARWWLENWIVDASGWPAVRPVVCCIVSSGPM